MTPTLARCARSQHERPIPHGFPLGLLAALPFEEANKSKALPMASGYLLRIISLFAEMSTIQGCALKSANQESAYRAHDVGLRAGIQASSHIP